LLGLEFTSHLHSVFPFSGPRDLLSPSQTTLSALKVAPVTRTTRYYFFEEPSNMPGIQQATVEPYEIRTKTVEPKEPSTSSMESPPPSPKNRGVNFSDSPVTSELRPISNKEGWALHYFEHHARKCADCHDPFDRHVHHEHLCEEGHLLAQDVARMLYAMKDGRIYSTKHSDRGRKDDKDEETYRLVRVEVPAGYTECLGLLRAIERCIRHRRRTPFVSFDRTYPIQPRVVQVSPSSKHRSHSEKAHSRSRRASHEDDTRRPSHRLREASPAVLTVETSPSRSQNRRQRPSNHRSSIQIVPWPAELSSSTESEDEATREREAHERAYERRNQQQQRSRGDSVTVAPAITAAPRPVEQPVLDIAANKRGSLYAADEKERKRESRRYYNVEVREPKFSKESGPVLVEPRRRKTVYYS
jgi:hypothetical protein